MPEAIRLAKRVIELMACSRREAELYILGGWVRVDGAVIVAPQFLVADQQVVIDPDADLYPVELVTLLASQNPGDSLIEASTRIHGATRASSFHSVMHVNSRHFVRLIEILPLAPDIAGLAIYSQDRALVARLHRFASDTHSVKAKSQQFATLRQHTCMCRAAITTTAQLTPLWQYSD
jgi:23S rRNA pseudouridine2604 synthase